MSSVATIAATTNAPATPTIHQRPEPFFRSAGFRSCMRLCSFAGRAVAKTDMRRRAREVAPNPAPRLVQAVGRVTSFAVTRRFSS
ncbi:hypothetical protein GCM10027258_83750 [Amycolatopsis stemonae]